MNSRVIILGEDHINTLGVIRVFGENNIIPYLFLVSDKKTNSITKSKYIKKYWICSNEQIAIDMIIKEFSNKNEKMVIIPTSDKSVSALDSRYNELCNNFLIYSLNNQENQINYYMDKFNQNKLFNACKVNCLNSYLLDLNNYNLKNIIYPVILKPNISAKGNKLDIKICDNVTDLEKYLEQLKEKGYNDILAQDFLNYDNEYDITGFMYKNKISISGMIKKIRIWPSKKGSTTFGEVYPIDEEVKKMIEKVLKAIKFEGIFDIELFEKNNTFYFNEINFRNSGISYAYRDYSPIYYWYLSNIENKFISSPSIKCNYFFMNDKAEIHHIIEKKLSILNYLKSRKKCRILLVKNKIDPKPGRYMIINKIKGIIKK